MTPQDSTRDELEELLARLAEATETIRAIRHGEVDALIGQGEAFLYAYAFLGVLGHDGCFYDFTVVLKVKARGSEFG